MKNHIVFVLCIFDCYVFDWEICLENVLIFYLFLFIFVYFVLILSNVVYCFHLNLKGKQC